MSEPLLSLTNDGGALSLALFDDFDTSVSLLSGNLYVQGNKLSGPLPSELGSIPDLSEW